MSSSQNMNGAAVRESAPLHPTAEIVYRYIIRFKRMNDGNSPTFREIMAGVGVPTTSMVDYHLDALERAGMITRSRHGHARRIGIPGAEWRFAETEVAQSER